MKRIMNWTGLFSGPVIIVGGVCLIARGPIQMVPYITDLERSSLVGLMIEEWQVSGGGRFISPISKRSSL